MYCQFHALYIFNAIDDQYKLALSRPNYSCKSPRISWQFLSRFWIRYSLAWYVNTYIDILAHSRIPCLPLVFLHYAYCLIIFIKLYIYINELINLIILSGYPCNYTKAIISDNTKLKINVLFNSIFYMRYYIFIHTRRWIH